MTAADKLRELLATRPNLPSIEQLASWWNTSGVLVASLLADYEAADLDLVAARADLERERVQHRANVEGFESALAQEQHEKSILEEVEAERCQQIADLRGRLEMAQPQPPLLSRLAELEEEGFWRSCTGCHEPNEGHPTGPYSPLFRCHLGGGCRECGGIGAVWEEGHPKSWLDCSECRARSESGAKPPRCPEWIAIEDAQRERMEAGHA